MNSAPSVLLSPGQGAVLFDVDGTLADTDPLHARAWQRIAKSRFGLSFTWADYHNACIVEGLSPAAFLLRLGADVRSKEIQAAKANAFRRLLRNELCLAPGVTPFLSRILEVAIKIAIVSSGSRNSVDAFLESLWPGPPPQVVVSREDTSHHKPHPEPYLLALEQLMRAAGNCLAVEDTDRGVQSAHRAGLRTVQVGRSETSAGPEADITVASLSDLSVVPDGHGGLMVRKIQVARQ